MCANSQSARCRGRSRSRRVELQRPGRRRASTTARRGRHTCCISRSDARRIGAGLGAVARRPRGEERADVARQVANRRQHAAHRAERAVGQLRLLLPLLVFPPIAVREPRRRHLSRLERRRRHAERLQDLVRDVGRGTACPTLGDDAAEDGEAVVRVLVGDAGRVRERNAAAHHRDNCVLGRRRAAGRPTGCPRESLGECDSRWRIVMRGESVVG